jgi:hypothetical protein
MLQFLLDCLLTCAQAFLVFIEAQQAILGATQFVIELNRAVEARADMSQIYEKMKKLEILLEPLNQRAESWNLPSSNTTPVDPSEEVLGRSLRAMAQIKLNRCVRHARGTTVGMTAGTLTVL